MKMSILVVGIAGVLLALPGVLQAQDVAQTDNVVIVLDDSGSMDGGMRDANNRNVDKMAAAKAALKEVLKAVPQTTQIGLVALNRGWLYPLGVRDDRKVNGIIDQINASGGTPLGDGMKKGADALLAQREKQYGYGSYRLLVVTDGEAGDQELVERYTPEIMARGITVDVIGVAMATAHTLATRVHSYRAANDPASLTRAIAQVLGEVSSSGSDVTADDAFAVIAPLPDELAAGAVKALAASGNHPIGETVVTPGTWKTTTPTSPPQYTGTTTPTQTPASSPNVGIVLLVILGIIVGAAILFAILGKALEY